MLRYCISTTILFSLIVSSKALAKDAVPAEDYPGVGRIQGYVAQSYDKKRFDAWEFEYRGNVVRVEGRKISVGYDCTPAATHECASVLGIQKEFEAVLRNLGGEILVRDPVETAPNGHFIGRFGAGGQTVYLDVIPSNNGEAYDLIILEEKAFVPTMTAATQVAADMKTSLKTTGKAVLYIGFDFDKAELKPEAAPVIQQIVSLLQMDPSLSLEIDGHTDSMGTDSHNKQLSAERAEAVSRAVQRGGVSSTRLSSRGLGSSVPVAENTTSEGRAQNRRVELINK